MSEREGQDGRSATEIGGQARPQDRIELLEDRLAEMDESGVPEARWHVRQRLGHAVAALFTAVLLLAWAVHTAMPNVLHNVFLRGLFAGR